MQKLLRRINYLELGLQGASRIQRPILSAHYLADLKPLVLAGHFLSKFSLEIGLFKTGSGLRSDVCGNLYYCFHPSRLWTNSIRFDFMSSEAVKKFCSILLRSWEVWTKRGAFRFNLPKLWFDSIFVSMTVWFWKLKNCSIKKTWLFTNWRKVVIWT